MTDAPFLTPELRAEMRAQIAAAEFREETRLGLCPAFTPRNVLALLDALERTERERDEAIADDEQAWREAEHFSRLTFVDVGANPAITWKERAETAEAALTAARASQREMAKALEPFSAVTGYQWIKDTAVADVDFTRRIPARNNHKRYLLSVGDFRTAARAYAAYRASETGGAE